MNLEESLSGITWQQASTKVYTFNTITTLVYHINYYASAILKVLQGEALQSKDKYSFDHPPVLSSDDWEQLLHKTWTDAELLAALIEQMPDSKLEETFVDEKYGSYYRNLHGLIEHTHYHLGQIVFRKKCYSKKQNKIGVLLLLHGNQNTSNKKC